MLSLCLFVFAEVVGAAVPLSLISVAASYLLIVFVLVNGSCNNMSSLYLRAKSLLRSRSSKVTGIPCEVGCKNERRRCLNSFAISYTRAVCCSFNADSSLSHCKVCYEAVCVSCYRILCSISNSILCNDLSLFSYNCDSGTPHGDASSPSRHRCNYNYASYLMHLSNNAYCFYSSSFGIFAAFILWSSPSSWLNLSEESSGSKDSGTFNGACLSWLR